LQALKSGRKITPLEALAEFGCFRLGARIWDLRQLGFPIKSKLQEVNNEKFVSIYWIDPKDLSENSGIAYPIDKFFKVKYD